MKTFCSEYCLLGWRTLVLKCNKNNYDWLTVPRARLCDCWVIDYDCNCMCAWIYLCIVCVFYTDMSMYCVYMTWHLLFQGLHTHAYLHSYMHTDIHTCTNSGPQPVRWIYTKGSRRCLFAGICLCLCMYVCMYVCVLYIWVYACHVYSWKVPENSYLQVCTCAYVCVCVFVHICMYMSTYSHMHTYTCWYSRVPAYGEAWAAWTHTYLRACIQIYTHTHT